MALIRARNAVTNDGIVLGPGIHYRLIELTIGHSSINGRKQFLDKPEEKA